jgi:hypothetical protein
MISSDLHGAEEPIRWLLGWQRQDNIVTSPCMKKKDVLIRDSLAEPGLGGSPIAEEMMAFVGQDATREDWTFSEGCGSVLGPFGTCGSLQEP